MASAQLNAADIYMTPVADTHSRDIDSRIDHERSSFERLLFRGNQVTVNTNISFFLLVLSYFKN